MNFAKNVEVEKTNDRMFVGRDEELKLLCDAYESVKSGNGPKIVAIHAESGFGKTRLAQEFYGWLSTHHDGIGGDGYWPDDLLQIENNLQVNPKIDECGTNFQKMPFLWWGLRISDPGARNQTADAAVPSGVPKLRPHLEYYLVQTQLEKLAKERGSFESLKSFAQEQGYEVMKGLADGIINSATFGIFELGKFVVNETLRINEQDAQIAKLKELDLKPSASAERNVDKLSEKILGHLSILCKSPPEGENPIPLVLLFDDIQWLDSDKGLESFVDLLLKRAHHEHWPLMVVFTCWSTQWLESKGAITKPARWMSESDEEIALSKNPELDQLIVSKFPGLSEDHISKLSLHADGNPRFLFEILNYLSRHPKHFENRDPNRAFKENEIEKILSKDFGDFIADRFDASPEDVKHALYIASVQGVTFSPELVKKVALEMNSKDLSEGLIKSDNPHSFTTLQDGGEFRIRPYRDIIYENLENVMDESDLLAATKQEIENLLQDIGSATDNELRTAFNFMGSHDNYGGSTAGVFCKVGLELKHRTRDDFFTLRWLNESIAPALQDCIGTIPMIDVASIVVSIEQYGYAGRLLEQTVNHFRNLSHLDPIGYVEDLCETSDTLRNPEYYLNAYEYAKEAVEFSERFALETKSDETQIILSMSYETLLKSIQYERFDLEGIEEPNDEEEHVLEKCVELNRILLSSNSTLKKREDQAKILHVLGGIKLESDPERANVFLKESEGLTSLIVEGSVEKRDFSTLDNNFFRLSSIYHCLSIVSKGFGELHTAKSYSLRALKVLRSAEKFLCDELQKLDNDGFNPIKGRMLQTCYAVSLEILNHLRNAAELTADLEGPCAANTYNEEIAQITSKVSERQDAYIEALDELDKILYGPTIN